MANDTKIKRISVNALEGVYKEQKHEIESVEWHGIEIQIRHRISLKDMLAFTAGVTQTCFAEETNAYLPEVKDFAIRCSVLEMYANFTLPDNVEYRYELVYNTDAVDVVLSHIDQAQYHEIVTAIDKKVAHLAQANISAIEIQMNHLYNAFAGLQEQFGKLFDGVKPEDISGMMKIFANGDVSEEKIVQEYIKQTTENGE